jgi:hypothetical protein
MSIGFYSASIQVVNSNIQFGLFTNTMKFSNENEILSTSDVMPVFIGANKRNDEKNKKSFIKYGNSNPIWQKSNNHIKVL